MDTPAPQQRHGVAPIERDPPVPLEAVIITSELGRRPSRPPGYEVESRAVAALMDVMANASGRAGADSVLQRLVQTALDLCRAHSAGVSILEKEDGREVFRWRAAAGAWAKFLGGSMPRELSPCGTVIEHNVPILMAHPERHYPYSADAPPIAEVLLIPFHCEGRPVGTIWIIAHDETRRFDSEDHRLMTSLSRLAATAYQLLVAHELRTALAAQRALDERLAADLDRLRRTRAALRHRDRAPSLWPQTWPVVAQYGLAIGAAAVAVGVRWLLDPVLGDRVPFITLFIVLLPLALLVRAGPFLAASLLGFTGARFLFIPPRFSFQMDSAVTASQMVLYGIAVVAVTITAWLSQRTGSGCAMRTRCSGPSSMRAQRASGSRTPMTASCTPTTPWPRPWDDPWTRSSAARTLSSFLRGSRSWPWTRFARCERPAGRPPRWRPSSRATVMVHIASWSGGASPCARAPRVTFSSPEWPTT
jgi:GAF domain-containing protein